MFATPANPGTVKVASVPAPIGGLNARDSIVVMEQTDAIILRNWWPQPYGCTVRKGYRLWASGLVGVISSLAALNNIDGTKYMFAWVDDEFYDITVTGVVAAPLITALTPAPWQTVSFANDAGGWMIAVNGFDDPIFATGATVGRFVAGDGIVPNTWDVLDPHDAIQLTTHQRRLWAVQKDTAVGWYLPPGAVYGDWEAFDFGPQMTRGGYLLFLANWTVDDGNGAEDHLVAFTSEGEAIVYSGTDVTDDAKWALAGVYYIGEPVAGRRTYAKVGGDLIILTQQGAVSMTETLVSIKAENQASRLKSDKIQFLITEVTTQYSGQFGWELKYFPHINMLLVNVPTPVDGGNIQLCSNQLINSWTQFNAMDATTWLNHDSAIYFGDYDGNVWLGWDGTVDAVGYTGIGGNSITATVQQAYSYLGAATQQKQIGMYRPNFITTVPVTFNSNIVYDFDTSILSAPDSVIPAVAALWNVDLWNLANWGGGTYVERRWIQARGMGNAASIQLGVRSTGETLWAATDYTYNVGSGVF